MSKSRRLTIVVHLALILALMLPAVALATPRAQGAAPTLHLKAATFTPAVGEQPALPPGLTVAAYNVNQRGYYIVQFQGPVEQAWKDQVTALGGEILDYIPDFAFKVRMNPAQAAQVAALDVVAWQGIFQPAYKLSPDLLRDGQHVYRIRVEQGADSGLTMAALRTAGADVIQRSGNILLVITDASQLEAMANVLDVAWVENFVFKQKHNEYGVGHILWNNQINPTYNGDTQIAAVADTGLGDGTPAGAHVGLNGRVNNIFNWTTNNARLCYRVQKDGPQDVDSGHGTHVAVSVVGDGAPNGYGRSAAPGAHLVFQAVEEYLDIYGACTSPTTPDGYYLIGIPDNLHQLFQQAYNAGARIHANSWGSNAAGDYTLDSANTDDFIWGNPDMTITFSAGNEGTDANANGVVDNDSIGSPATAKNIITIGASENARDDNFPCDTSLGYVSHDSYQSGQTCASMGGQNWLGTAGVRWGFTAEPLNSDPTAGNAEQMAPFSSRGPTDDGRIKPDVVAPGTWILSGYSDMYQEYYDGAPNPQNGAYQVDGWGMPFDANYKYFGGTSMSNPIAAGAATVVRDFYQKAYSHNASAALTKATLINSAVDLLDENNDGANDNDFPIPNVHEGWGRINLVNATDGTAEYVDDGAGLATNGSVNYQFAVDTAGSAFKVTLVWSDYASTEAASVNLVNDLDLVVTAPGGSTVYRGNVFAGGWSQTGGSGDRRNNVENVYVQSAAAGTWNVQITGYNVPNGPQPFALVVDDSTAGPVNNMPNVTIVNPANATTVSSDVPVQISATDVEDAAGTLDVQWNVDGGTWQSATYNNSTGYYEASWMSSSVADGSHTINAKATDSGNSLGQASTTVTVDNVAEQPVHIGDLDGVTASGKGGKWDATITITVHSGSESPVAGVTVSGAWSAGASGSGQCTANASGQCSITQNGISRNSSSATFNVTGIAANGYVYTASANHDPDGDSNGTSITVLKP